MPEESSESVDPIVELQALELARLLRDNNRLNQRIDFLIGEIKWLRELQERELVLRESEQAMHRKAQDAIKSLIADGAATGGVETGRTRPAGTVRDQAATETVLAESLAGFAEHPLAAESAEPADEPALPAFLTAGAEATLTPVPANEPADDTPTGWDGGATDAPDQRDANPPRRFGLWGRRSSRNRTDPQNSAVSGGD
ncbi:MAG: hypothetical protein MI806_06450 [Minwuiales bacterium]|nr:hypothetical protein [Minwuiales bacterium]